MTLQIQEARESNVDIILRALKEYPGRPTVRQLNGWLYVPINAEFPYGQKKMRPGFERNGRPWTEKKVQHDLYYLCDEGRAWMVRVGPNYNEYWLAPEELFK